MTNRVGKRGYGLRMMVEITEKRPMSTGSGCWHCFVKNFWLLPAFFQLQKKLRKKKRFSGYGFRLLRQAIQGAALKIRNFLEKIE